MAYTNVYNGSYSDLSEITVNALTMEDAIKELKRIRSDTEPSMLRLVIAEIRVPDSVPTASIVCQAQMIGQGELPTTVTVRPYSPIERTAGSTVMLYAIDTAETPTVEFVGWYDETDTLLSEEATFAYTVPEYITSGQAIVLTAKFKEV